MKNLVLGISVAVVGACNAVSPSGMAAERATAGAVAAAPDATPLVKSMRNHVASLRGSIDNLDAIARQASSDEWMDEKGDAKAKRDLAVADWYADAHRYRVWIDTYCKELKPSDSIAQRRIVEVDSLGGRVAITQSALLEIVSQLELRNIEARLAPAASFRFQGAPYTAIKIDPARFKLSLHWKNPAGANYYAIQNLKDQLEKEHQKVVMITNGGMYNPDNSPEGLFIQNGKQLVPLDTSAGPSGKTLNFYLKPNGVFYVDGQGPHVAITEKFPQKRAGIQLATQSGPMLVIDGEIHPKFTKGSANTNIRSGVGITKDHQIVFAISDQPVNFHDFATLFKVGLHCDNALYLDGAISQMYLPNTQRMNLGGDFGPIIAVTGKE